MLACIKLGAVVIPATTLLGPRDLADRDRARRGPARRRRVGGHREVRRRPAATGPASPSAHRSPAGCGTTTRTSTSRPSTAEVETKADETLLLYFTSGTTARPKLVEHTHTSYPVGHLSTAYWIGLQPGDVHLNVSSPGWAKHAWSNVFAPWIAGATAFVVNQPRFDAAGAARHDGPVRRDHVLRAADGVADARAGGPRGAPGAVAARGRRRRRAAQPRGHRAGAAGLGQDRARRLRADRDHRADRQPARRAAQAGVDGPAAAGLHRRAARPGHVRGRHRGRDLPRPRPRGPPR